MDRAQFSMNLPLEDQCMTGCILHVPGCIFREFGMSFNIIMKSPMFEYFENTPKFKFARRASAISLKCGGMKTINLIWP